MSRRYRLGPGAAMLTLLVVVLGMSALGVLTLMSARNDEVLSGRSAQMTESVYRLDAAAERSFAALDAVLAAARRDSGEAAYREDVAASLPEGMQMDGSIVRWVERSDDGRSLICAVALAPAGELPRAQWVEHRLATDLEGWAD